MLSVQNEINDFIQTDFIIIDQNEQDTQAIVDKTITSNPEKRVFQLRQGNIYFLKCIKEAIWQKCKIIAVPNNMNSLVTTIKREMNETDYLLMIKNKQGKFIGYLEKDNFISTLFHKYEQQDAFFQTVLDTIDSSCTVIDHNKKVLIWTKGAEKLFSIKKEDIIGQNIADFFHRDDLEIIKTLQSGTSEIHKQHHAQDNLIVLINSNPVRLHNQTIGAVVSETDITSQFRMNQQLFKVSEKVIELEKRMKNLREPVDPFIHIKGSSSYLKDTVNKTKKIASTHANILVLGESGVGKELFVKAIHDLREEKNAPFIPINCGAIPAALFESELFGYEKGAFSGADQKGKKGKVELARNGTLFLDEIGEMPLDMQVKLLRVLQEKRFFPIGGTKEVDVDFRIIAATNRNLEELIEEGKFREDLYYRLNVVSLDIPPLRKRIEDIIELTHYFLYEFSTKYQRPVHGISQEIMQALIQYQWPGNVRELRNVIERLIVFSEDGELDLNNLPFYNKKVSLAPTKQTTTDELSLNERLEHYERDIILHELDRTQGNKKLCAKQLNISRATLYNRMKKLDIQL